MENKERTCVENNLEIITSEGKNKVLTNNKITLIEERVRRI